MFFKGFQFLDRNFFFGKIIELFGNFGNFGKIGNFGKLINIFQNIGLNMKLTNRQDTFIKNLLELYTEFQEPIHYTVLAERLGVSRFTAYDMLRVLEEKGFVRSEYRLSSDENKTGRSERVFLPTEKAHNLISVLTIENKEYNWEIIKERIIELINAGDNIDLDIGPELLARVPPESDDAIQYCIEVVTIMALHARHTDTSTKLRKYIMEKIPSKQLTHKAFLSLMSGFALGALAMDNNDDDEWMDELLIHVIKFQEYVLNFSEAQCLQLAEGIREHFYEMLAIFPQEGLEIEDINKINLNQEKKSK